MSTYRLAEQLPPDFSALTSYTPLLRQLSFARGIKTDEDAAAFFAPDYNTELHDPFLLPDMQVAVDRIKQAIADDEAIVVYSDYDCDGIPGGVVLHDLFSALEYKQFHNHIPHRHYDGFGLHSEAVEKLAKSGTKLIITVDCGTTDVAAVARASELGVDVIITDHHQPGETLPEAVAIVNPTIGDLYPFPHLCGAAVAFKLAQALLSAVEHSLAPGQEKWWLDMVGIATIADMVPLTGENRVFAHYGLMVLRKSRRPGLQQLLKKQRASQRHLTEDDIGFTIGPRINAASRMDAPEDAFHMLAESDLTKASTYVEHLEKLNNERKGAVAAMTREVHLRLKELTEVPDVLVLGNPDWRPSLVGLTANKLAEEFNRPTFVWGRDGRGKLKGSCRSNGLVSVHKLMTAAADAFLEFGGHDFAGGFGVSDDGIHHLATALNEAYATMGNAAAVDAEVVVDAELIPSEVSTEVLKSLQQLAPFGVGNDKPLFAITDVVPSDVGVFGKTKEHTKLVFSGSPLVSEAITFFKLPEQFTREPKVGESCTLLAHLEQSFFMGRLQTRLRIIDIL